MLVDRDPAWCKNTFIRDGEVRVGLEIEMILSMVVPLPDAGPSNYTCRLFDGTNCTAYDIRPDMCKSYPYSRPCEHADKCQWDDARAGKHPRLLPIAG